jgi:CRP-like cAMP-binding protein
MSAIRDSLVQVPLFRDINKKGIDRLEKIARTRTFRPGEEIVKEGDEGVGFFLLTKGSAEVVRGDTQLASYGPGDFFGEMALLDAHRRSATVRAKEPTECIAMSRWDFVSELRANPDLALEMLAVMSRRLRDADTRLAERD